MILCAIDPGNIDSAVVLIRTENFEIIDFYKGDNSKVRGELYSEQIDRVAIEMIASYGLAVGKEVFETCVAVGRFMQIAYQRNIPCEFVYRKDVKLHLCNSPRAKDGNVMRALIDRFAKHDFKSGKGTAKNQDYFYGFKSDIWAAFAVACYWIDEKKGQLNNG